MRLRLRATAVLLTIVAVFSAACSSGDDPTGRAADPVDTLLDQARTAAKTATAVHMTGTWVTKNVEYQIDMRIKTDGATGEVTTAGTKIELLRVGADLFVRGDESLYAPRDGRQDPGADESAQMLRDKFVKVPPDDPAFARLSGFTQLHPLLDDLFRLGGKVKKDGRKNVRGTETLILSGDKGRGGELDIALGDSAPFPMQYSPGLNAGRLDLYEYNQDFPVGPPPGDKVVDYGSLTGASPTGKPGTDADGDGPSSPSGSPKPSGTSTKNPS